MQICILIVSIKLFLLQMNMISDKARDILKPL